MKQIEVNEQNVVTNLTLCCAIEVHLDDITPVT
jgi:hypothetical protein